MVHLALQLGVFFGIFKRMFPTHTWTVNIENICINFVSPFDYKTMKDVPKIYATSSNLSSKKTTNNPNLVPLESQKISKKSAYQKKTKTKKN